MNARNEILDELRMLSEVLVNISRETPYRVPVGYFDDLSRQVQLRLGEDKTLPDAELLASLTSLEDPTFLTDLTNLTSPGYKVPEGYFESFAGKVLDQIKKGQTHSVPLSSPGELASLSSREELASLSSMLNGIGRTMPYQVPEGYFEGLSSEFIYWKEESTVLSGLREKALYAAPEGYFEDLAQTVMGKIGILTDEEEETEQKEIKPLFGKLVPMRGRSWWRYSAAAVVAGLILSIGWLRLRHSGTSEVAGTRTTDITKNLYKVSDQEILNYLDSQSVLQDDGAAPAGTPTAALETNATEVKALLGNVPDRDLKQYMEERGREGDLATN